MLYDTASKAILEHKTHTHTHTPANSHISKHSKTTPDTQECQSKTREKIKQTPPKEKQTWQDYKSVATTSKV